MALESGDVEEFYYREAYLNWHRGHHGMTVDDEAVIAMASRMIQAMVGMRILRKLGLLS